MNKTLLLAWTMFRGTVWRSTRTAVGRLAKKKGVGRAGNVLLSMFLVAYLGTLSVLAVRGIYPALDEMGMAAVIPAMVVSALSILTFLFGVLYTMSVYYHASDVDRLLPLPFLPGQIIFAKFLTTLLYEYLMVFLIGLPALTTYGILSEAGVAYYILLLITLLVLPVTPLALASVLVILLMRFSPAARNKDRFNMISSIGIMVLTIGFVFLIQKAQSLDGADLAGMLAQTTAEIARVTAGVFPGTSMAAAMLVDFRAGSALVDLAGFLAIAAAAILILTLVARAFYLRGVMGVGASYARRRALTGREQQEATASGSAFWTYVRKEVRILFRTPIFFLNNVMMNVLFPVFFLVPILVTFSAEGTPVPALLEQLRAATFGPGAQGAPIALGILSAATILICGMNGITASALSREGGGAYFMKFIPMSYRAQIAAKVTTGLLISLAPALMLVLIGTIVLAPPVWFVPVMLLAALAAMPISNLGGILFDLRRPKLDWDDEQKAVKQNMNVLYAMLLSMVGAGALVAVSFLIQGVVPYASGVPGMVLALLLPLLADALLLTAVLRWGPRQIKNLMV